MTTQEILKELAKPITPKWRFGKNLNNDKCTVLPYLMASQIYQRLDDVVGGDNWQNTYDPESGVSSISIKLDGEWVSKSNVGTDSKVEKEKGKASDAVKRAATLWGIGRDLNIMGSKVMQCADGKHPVVTIGGQSRKLFDGAQLTAYMNGISAGQGLLAQLYNTYPSLREDKDFMDSLSKLKELIKTQEYVL